MIFSLPCEIVALSFCSYSAGLIALNQICNANDRRIPIKILSSGHAALATVATIYALRQTWTMNPPTLVRLSAKYLDDTKNPLIHGKTALGNAITSWETGYLLYDTCALIWAGIPPSANPASPASIAKSLLRFMRKDPVIFGHHIGLLTALSVLQIYIARGQERGVPVILAFILMNASTPLLHLRWWYRRTYGRDNLSLDLVFASAFALRFAIVAWIVAKYAEYHGIDSWSAIRRQRWICQAGTAALLGLNGVWWTVLVTRTLRRALNRPKKI